MLRLTWVGGVALVSESLSTTTRFLGLPMQTSARIIKTFCRHSNLLLTRLFLGSPTQKGIARYSVSGHAQKPLAGAFHNAIFNTFRRVKGQAFYVIFPVTIYYYIWKQAESYNHWLYTKAGREELERVSA